MYVALPWQGLRFPRQPVCDLELTQISQPLSGSQLPDTIIFSQIANGCAL